MATEAYTLPSRCRMLTDKSRSYSAEPAYNGYDQAQAPAITESQSTGIGRRALGDMSGDDTLSGILRESWQETRQELRGLRSDLSGMAVDLAAVKTDVGWIKKLGLLIFGAVVTAVVKYVFFPTPPTP